MIWSHPLLLGRDPASEAEITSLSGLKSLDDLASRLLRSKEFQERDQRHNPARLKSADVVSQARWNNAGRRPPHEGVRALFLGNCQANEIATLVSIMSKDVQTASVKIVPKAAKDTAEEDSEFGSEATKIASLVSEADLVLLQLHLVEAVNKRFPEARSKIRLFPAISFPGFHPDMIHVWSRNASVVAGPTGGYHSSIALYGWKHKLSPEETMSLYAEDVYRHLGFFNYWKGSVDYLTKHGREADLPLDQLIERWTGRGVWMHSTNHPALFVLADIARAILEREGIPFQPGVEMALRDNLTDQASWFVYPEIAQRIGNLEGHYLFRKARGGRPYDHSVDTLDLREFVTASYACYEQNSNAGLESERLATPAYESLAGFIQQRGKPKPANDRGIEAREQSSTRTAANPYQGLKDYQFWRRSVEQPSIANVDPVTHPRFSINRQQNIATGGSCFAQHVSRELVARKFNYYVAECPPAHINSELSRIRNFGVFSARYGNIYTARQLIQLFDRAYGTFCPSEPPWIRENGLPADPFRPEIEPYGFQNTDLLEASRKHHLACVRRMFENLDVFVFTMGLTEAWQSKSDGAVFPLAPGVVAGKFDEHRYQFVNFGVEEVIQDLDRFVNQLLKVNSRAKIILTVSPVPLIATYEDRHVMVSTTYSKSVLRVSADEICRRYRHACDYFPSYEIITGSFTRGAYFEKDLRSVNPAGIEHVMRLFLSHYSAGTENADLKEEIDAVSKIVCEEELIDAASTR